MFMTWSVEGRHLVGRHEERKFDDWTVEDRHGAERHEERKFDDWTVEDRHGAVQLNLESETFDILLF